MIRVPLWIWASGGLLGTAAALSPGAAFVLLLVAATSCALRRFSAERDRPFLIRLFLVAFAVRALFSLTLDLGSWIAEGHPPIDRGPPEYWNLGIADKTRDYLRMGDSDVYSQRGYALAQYASGNREAVVLRRIQVYGWNAYVFVIGWFYTLFGFSPVTVKWVNGWIGSLHVLAFFFLARSCFQPTIARWAGAGVALFPTLVLWSATNLKEPLMFLLTALLLLLFRGIQQERCLGRCAVFVGLSAAAFYLLNRLGRQEFFLALAALLGLVLCVEWCLRRRWHAALLLLAVALFRFGPPAVAGGLQLAAYRHNAYVHGTGMTYHYLPDAFYSTPGMAPDMLLLLRKTPLALLHYFLQPVPARAGGWLDVLLVPQMVAWYFLLPLALIGAAAGLLWNARNCAFLAVAGSAWAVMGALSNANIGTLIRVRDMVTPIVLLFAAAGLWALARGKEGFCREA